MKLSADFIEFVRKNRYRPNSLPDRIFKEIVDYRRSHNLDGRDIPDPWLQGDEVLEYELQKLGTVFEALRKCPSDCGKGAVIDVLKERYKSSEVDEIVAEYFPELSRHTASA